VATARRNRGGLTRGGTAAASRQRKRGASIAITGANTFLGRNLVAVLEEDPTVSKVVVLDLENPSTSRRKTSFYEVDLTQPGVDSRIAEILHAESCTALVHLAFPVSPTQAVAWAHELESVGTMHVLSACQQHKPAQVVLCGSTLVYGPHPDNPNFLSEDHAARGLHGAPFIEDKLDAEQQFARFAEASPQCVVTVLRMAPMLGPTVDNFVARTLTRPLVPTVLGFDPLVQFLHEVDAVSALKLALERATPGTFNIVGEGVLPVSTVVKLAGRLGVPIPYRLYRQLTGFLWAMQLGEAPAAFVAAMRYLCVADGAKAADQLGFSPAYSTRDAVLDFEGALRLREARALRGGA